MLMEENIALPIVTHENSIHYHVVLIGVGGTGGYILRSLVRKAHSYQMNSEDRFTITICDGDSVEASNILRQDFIEADIHKRKVDVLAKRFSQAYGIPIRKRDTYVEDIESLRNLCSHDEANFTIVVGAVDNNATRQLLNQYFKEVRNIVYIDAGNDSVMTSDKSYEELTAEEKQEIEQSGYTGQVVLGWKLNGKTILPPVGHVYPDMMEDKETFFPSQSCGREVVYHPQRGMTNEVAAMVVTTYLNNLFGQREIVSHETTFNAHTMKSTPKYITKSYMEYLAGQQK